MVKKSFLGLAVALIVTGGARNADVCGAAEFGPDKKGHLGPDDFLVVEKNGEISFYEGVCKPKRGRGNGFVCDSGGAYSNDGGTMNVEVLRGGGELKGVKIGKSLFFYCGGKVLKPVI